MYVSCICVAQERGTWLKIANRQLMCASEIGSPKPLSQSVAAYGAFGTYSPVLGNSYFRPAQSSEPFDTSSNWLEPVGKWENMFRVVFKRRVSGQIPAYYRKGPDYSRS